MKGYLVIDDISLDEAKKLIKRLKKKGKWLSETAMAKVDNAAAFSMLTHSFPKIEPHEVHEFKDSLDK